MLTNKNLLQQLLVELLDNRLKRLEKRNTEEKQDLNFIKFQNKKQILVLNQLSKKISKTINSKKRVPFKNSLTQKSKIIKQKRFQNSNKIKLSPKHQKKNHIFLKALTPTKPLSIYTLTNENWTKKRNYKYKYVKSRYMDATIKINESKIKNNRENRKIYFTPEPRIKKKQKKITINDRINIEPKKLNLEKIEIKTKNNIKTKKKEILHNKNTMISDIDLGKEEITFVLNELKKEKEKNSENSEEEEESEDPNSKNKNINENSSSINKSNSSESFNKQAYTVKSKEVILEFSEYINSPEGNHIILLIASFLDLKTKFYFFSCSKKLIKNLYNELDNIYKYILDMNKISSINSLEVDLNKIKQKYKGEDFDSLKYSFKLSNGSIKAIEILDDEVYNDIFKLKEFNPKLNDIIIIYRIFFQLINKEELIEIQSDKLFWKEASNFFLENNNNKIGSFIKEYITEFDYTKENIYKIKKLVMGKEDKLKPTYYENICKTTALISFIIKDSLEYCGIIPKENKMMPGVYISYLEYLKENLNKCKEYMYLIKSYK